MGLIWSLAAEFRVYTLYCTTEILCLQFEVDAGSAVLCHTFPDLTHTHAFVPLKVQPSWENNVVADAGWDEKLDGGKLCLYHTTTAEHNSQKAEQATLVTPVGDTLAMFNSRMEHEVLPSFADRYSLALMSGGNQRLVTIILSTIHVEV